ncbi:MAG: hypothetical protein ABIG61_17005 [Planctomycetota bacterium]
MPLGIRIVGIFIIFCSLLLMIKPLLIDRMLRFFRKGKRIYVIALIRLVLAVIFLIGASSCRVPTGIIIIGIVLLLTSLMIFSIRLEKSTAIMQWFQNRSILSKEIALLAALLIGAVIVYCA